MNLPPANINFKLKYLKSIFEENCEPPNTLCWAGCLEAAERAFGPPPTAETTGDTRPNAVRARWSPGRAEPDEGGVWRTP